MGTTTIATIFGASDTVVNNEGGQLNDTNTAFQLAAISTSYAGIFDPVVAGAAVNIGGSAFVTGAAAFLADYNNNSSKTNLAADSITVIGDGILTAAAIFGQSSNLATRDFAAGLAVFGDALAITGVAIKNWDKVTTNTPIAMNELFTEINQAMAGETALITPIAATLAGASTSVINSWNALSTGLNNTLKDISGYLNSSTALTTVSNDTNVLKTSLVDFFNASGQTPQNTTQTVSGTHFVVTDTNNTVLTNGNFNLASAGGSTSLNSTGNNNAFQQNESVSISSTNGITDNLQRYNSSGVSQYTQSTNTDINGTITATISGTGDVAYLTGAGITLQSGASASITGSSNTTTVFQSAYASVYGDNNTLILNTGAAGANVTGNNGYINNGSGVGVTVTGAGAQVNVGGFNLKASLGSYDINTRLDNIKLANSSIISVAPGSQVTLTGSDGNMVAYNNQGSVNNTINYNSDSNGFGVSTSSGYSAHYDSVQEQFTGLSAGVARQDSWYGSDNSKFSTIKISDGSMVDTQLAQLVQANDNYPLHEKMFKVG